MDAHKELLAEFDRESGITRKILAAIPADADFTFKSHPKSMSLGRIAGHTAEIFTEWPVATLTLDVLDMSHGGFAPYTATSTAALLEKFDAELAKAKAALAAFDPAHWMDIWKLTRGDQVFVQGPKWEIFRTWIISHGIHHRAQLGVDLRLLGAKIPGTYGPSADEMPGA
jgi:uncharacterized damage-inducible protein DinB